MRGQNDPKLKRPAKKSRKRRSKKAKVSRSALAKPRCTRISLRGRIAHSITTSILEPTDEPDPGDSIELDYCDDHSSSFEEEKTTCSISSSTEVLETNKEMCVSYEEYQGQKLESETTEDFKSAIHNTSPEHNYSESFDYVDCGSARLCATSTDLMDSVSEEPIFVDLTTDESKTSWKQSILKQLYEVNNSTETSVDSLAEDKIYGIENSIGELRIMIADSSSKMHRGATSHNLATALKDRGPCVMPVQPNRCLPIRPTPPVPTRSCRKEPLSILKLCKGISFDTEEHELLKSMSPTTNLQINEETDIDIDEQKGNDLLSKESTGFENENLSDIINSDYAGILKRKIDKKIGDEENSSVEEKKRKKSYKADCNQFKEKDVDSIDKEPITRQQDLETEIEKKCTTILMSRIENTGEKNKSNCDKLVPPLRLKKIISSEGECYRNADIVTELGEESNYRIVTGATPRPETRFTPISATSSWDSMNYEKDLSIENFFEVSTTEDSNMQTALNSDGHKLKSRRNRLRQKLRELRRKAFELAEEMASTETDSSSQENTRLKQAMNRYEKQIENLSKLLEKLSATMPLSSSDIIDVTQEHNACIDNKVTLLECTKTKKEHAESKMVKTGISPNSSPEPPKLSPRPPLNYAKDKLPLEGFSDSPPILPRISLTVPSNFEAREDEARFSTCSKIWAINNGDSSKQLKKENHFNTGLDKQKDCECNDIEAKGKHVPFLTSVNQERENTIISDKICKGPCSINQKTALNEALQYDGNGQCDEALEKKKESQHTESTSTKAMPHNSLASEECEKNEHFKPAETKNTASKSVKAPENDGTEGSKNLDSNQLYEPSVSSAPNKKQPQIKDSILNSQSNYYDPMPVRNNILMNDTTEDTHHAQQITPTTSQPMVLDDASATVSFAQVTPNTSNQQRVALSKECKGDTLQNDVAQNNEGLRIMSEQFPTLGSWVARLSKKQQSRSKSKTQDPVNTINPPIEHVASFSGSDVQKNPSSNTNNTPRNNVVNVAPQWNAERWQRHQNQQRQQQLLDQVAFSGGPSQPLSVPPPLRPNMCAPISMLPNPQLCANSYGIDPYGGTSLGYHGAMYLYGTYPYHSRLHPGLPPPPTNYHIPIPESLNPQLRPLQHLDKRFAALQDSIRHIPADIIKYSGSMSTANYQHPSGIDFDRLRTASSATQVPSGSCVPPLLTVPPPPPPQSHPPSTLSSSVQHNLPRSSLSSYSTNNGQFVRNRMIPDVVAAAAAAAVVAAASISRQDAPLSSYSQQEADGSSARTMSGNAQSEPLSTTISIKPIEVADFTNQIQANVNNFNQETRQNNAGYQQLQNLILERMPFVKKSDSFFPPNTLTQEASISTSGPTSTSYKLSTSSNLRPQLSKDSPGSNSRSCETPHLGKVIRGPNASNDLACSNCGLTGSKFKCLGCESTFYCNERCQTRHWRVHVEKCPKRMPKLKKVT